MQITDKTIYILSPEPWGTSFVSKHHYATLLAAQGNRVFFINPPSQQSSKTKIAKNLTVIDYTAGMLRGLNRLPAFLRNFFNQILIRKLEKQIGQKPDIIWSFDPFRFQNLALFGAIAKIYHPVDVHQSPLEIEAVQTADVIFSTAHKILERFDANTPMHFINHGLANHFLETPPDIDFSVDKEVVNVGYVGNMNYQYLDKVQLYKILTDNTKVQFYFIGPYQKSNLSEAFNHEFIEQIKGLPNVHILGPKPSKELPAYLQKMDLFLMCYTGDKNVAQMANPHKILEYLSTGKPVITHFIDEYKDKPNLVWMANDNKALPDLFKKAIFALPTLNQNQLQVERRKFAEANTYVQQLERISDSLFKYCKTLDRQ